MTRMRVTSVHVAGVSVRDVTGMRVAGMTVASMAMAGVTGVREAHDRHCGEPRGARREREDVKVHG